MKKSTTCIVMALLCLNFLARGQDIQKLNIGDKIPDVLWQRTFKTINGDGSEATFKLADYRGKLIVLDFWATSCSACIEGFSKIEPLQQKFPSELKVILVNYIEPHDKVKDFFAKRLSNNRPIGLSSIVSDSSLKQYFPFRVIPHYAWISRDGILLTTTSSLNLDEAHVMSFFNSKVNISEAKVDLNIQRPIYMTESLPQDYIEQFSLLIKGLLIEGAGSSSYVRYKNDVPVGILLTNNSILEFFEYCFSNLDPTYSRQRLKLQVSDTTGLIPPDNQSHADLLNWHLKNDYSYDFMVPLHKANKLYSLMLENLSMCSPYQGSLIKRNQKSIVITGVADRLLSKNGEERIDQIEDGRLKLNNVPLDALKNRLNSDLYFGLPVLNETGLKDKINLHFDQPVHSLSELKRQLKKSGINFKILYRVTSEFSIRDKDLRSSQ